MLELRVVVAVLGSVTDQVTAPAGCALAPAIPEMVVVSVVVPPRVGLADACRVMTGVCRANVEVT